MRWTEFSKIKRIKSPELNKSFLTKLNREIDALDLDWKAIRQVLYVLGTVVACLILLPAFGIGAATITLGGGFMLLALNHREINDVIKRISFVDILFFIALFILVGGALHSGLLEKIAALLQATTGANRYLYTIYLLWGMGCRSDHGLFECWACIRFFYSSRDAVSIHCLKRYRLVGIVFRNSGRF